jgi:hypothetical protein
MHALDQVSRATRNPRFNLWGRELADAAHAAFAGEAERARERRMVWKMSTDLSRPLVPSMGQHDPLDGLITCIQLETTASLLESAATGPSLKRATADFEAMLEDADLRTDDLLGIGGLLSDACRVAQIMSQGAFQGESLLETLLAAAQEGLARYSRQADSEAPPSRRLAFRELGLVIGLSAVGLLREEMESDRSRLVGAGGRTRIEGLAKYAPLGSAILSFWLDPRQRLPRTWSEHRDINEVMLATSLCPDGFLALRSPQALGSGWTG